MVRFLWSEGLPGAEIHKKLLAQYETMHHQKERYMSGLKSLKLAGPV